MDELRFEGIVSAGAGRHSELGIPGRSEATQAPDDWPVALHPGSLNVRVDCYPKDFRARGLSERIASLDSGLFVPAFEIPRDQLRNNGLAASQSLPRKGDAQVWRAKIVTATREIEGVWVLRRFGSGVCEQLEFVSDRKLRDQGLQDGQRIAAVLYGDWKNA